MTNLWWLAIPVALSIWELRPLPVQTLTAMSSCYHVKNVQRPCPAAADCHAKKLAGRDRERVETDNRAALAPQHPGGVAVAGDGLPPSA